MTVSSEQSFIEYNGDGATQTFTVPFYFILNSDLSVTVADASGNLDDLTYGVDFSASGGGNPDGGTATLNTAYPSGYTILIYRNPPETQETAYYENGKFPAKSHEKALDKLTMLIQKYGWWFDSLALKKPSYLAQYYDAQGNRISNLADPVNSQDAVTKGYVDSGSNKTLRVPEAIPVLPNASTRAGKIVAFDNAGSPIVVLPASGSASDVMIQLASNDGEKYIGECPTIAVLRTLEPSYDKQRITLREYAAGSRKGGGQLRAVLSGSAYTDNGVTVFKTPSGAAWVRINADIVNPLMAGALGTGLTTDDDTVALQRIQTLAGVTVDFLGLTYYITADLGFSGNRASVFKNGIIKPSATVSNVARVSNAAHTIDGLSIDGALAVNGIGYNVDISATGVTIKNLTINNMGRSAIVNNAFNATIDKVNADGCGLLAVSPFVNTIYMIANEGSVVKNCNLTRCYNAVYFRTDLAAGKTARNKLLNCFMRGNGQTADAGAQGVSCANNLNLEISGCHIYDFPNNAIDLQFSDYCDVHDNYVNNCQDGVFIGDRSCRGHKIHNNHFENCVRGFRFYCASPELSASFYDNSFTGNTITSPKIIGIYVWLPDAVDSGRNNISDNTITMLNSVAGATHGIVINKLFNSRVSDNTITGCPQNGLVITGACSGVRANSNSIFSSSRGNTNTYDAVYVDPAANRCFIKDTVCEGGGKAAVNVVGGTNHTVTGTRWRAMGTGGVINGGTGTVLSDNVAY